MKKIYIFHHATVCDGNLIERAVKIGDEKCCNDDSIQSVCNLHKTLKPGLHIVVRVAEHASDDVLKRILKLSTYPLQIFLVKHQYL